MTPMKNIIEACGAWAGATNATTCSTIWHSEVRGAVAKLGGLRNEHGAAYMDSADGRSRLNRAWAAGEPVWMAAESALAFCKGAAKAAEDDRCHDMDSLLAPYRASRVAQ